MSNRRLSEIECFAARERTSLRPALHSSTTPECGKLGCGVGLERSKSPVLIAERATAQHLGAVLDGLDHGVGWPHAMGVVEHLPCIRP